MIKALAHPAVLRIIWRELGRPGWFDCVSYLEGPAPRHQRFGAHPVFAEHVAPLCTAAPLVAPYSITHLSDGRPLALLRTRDDPPVAFDEDVLQLAERGLPADTFFVDPGHGVAFRGAEQPPEPGRGSGERPFLLLAQAADCLASPVRGLPLTLACSAPSSQDPAAEAGRRARISLTAAGSEGATPPPGIIDIPPDLNATRLHLSAAPHAAGVDWLIEAESALGHRHRLPVQDDLDPEPPHVALILDRTCVDPLRWVLARQLLLDPEAVMAHIREHQARDPRLARPSEWNLMLRETLEDWIAQTLAARAAASCSLFWCADRPGGLAYPQLPGLSEPAAFAGELDVISAAHPYEARRSLALAGYAPGIDMYDALADAVDLAINRLWSLPTRGPRGIILVGDSPPHPDAGDDQDPILTAIEAVTGRHSSRAAGNGPSWHALLRLAHSHNIHVAYVFIRTRIQDALDWIPPDDEERAATEADFMRCAEIKARVERAVGESLKTNAGSFHLAVSSREALLGALEAALRQIRDGPIRSALLLEPVRSP